MPYFDDVKKKRTTRADHMRQDAWKEDEGAGYRKGTFGAKGRNSKPDMYRKDERGGYHSANSKGGKRDFDKKNDRSGRDFKKSAPRPQTEQRPLKTIVAPKPAVEEELIDNILTGRNPIREALKSGRDIEKLMVAKGDLSGTAREIVAMAHEAHVPVQMVERIRLDEIAKNHQGMIAFASAYQYADVDDMLQVAAEKEEDPFLIILDGVTDPHNLGAVIRTAAAVGAHGVIVPERRAVGLTPAAVKASAGGVEHIKVARVVNLTNEIKRLQEKGVWFYGADAEGEDYRKVNFSGSCALIIGSEGDGISRLVREQCDHIVSIPMKNPAMESLNASVAAGILMYAAAAARD